MNGNKETAEMKFCASKLSQANSKGQYALGSRTDLLHIRVSSSNTDDPLILQDSNGRLAARAGGPGWQSKDLCTQCQSVNLTQICSKGSLYGTGGTDVFLHISETSTCPSCRFLTSQLHRKDNVAKSQDPITVQLNRSIFDGIDHVVMRLNNELEYILPITDKNMLGAPGRIGQHRQIPKFRLLDCKTKTVVELTVFVEYVALSYVWGSSSNLHESDRAIMAKAVIKDAIYVTIQLGFRYIWIDQLCIDQTNTQDMNCQLGQMNTIYNQASVTIIAAAGESSLHGLPGVGQCPRTIPNNFILDGTTWRYKPISFANHVGASRWSTRGWTYQEAVFSRRCVIFADDQVFYQCGSMTCAEELIHDFESCERVVFPIFERILYQDSDSRVYLPSSWRFMTNLEAYSKRELTYDSDVLRAMEGIFGFYAQLEPPVEQYWGLPHRWVGCQLSNLYRKDVYHVAKSKHNDVVVAILWAMLWEPRWSEIQIPESGLARRDGFPTWSWSGWKVGVRWNFLENVKHLERSFTAPLFAETTAGTLVELNDTLARSLTSGQSYPTLGLTYILRITTKVFDVPFMELAPYRPTRTWAKSNSFPTRRKSQHWVTMDDQSLEGRWTHFVVQKNIETPGRGIVWSLDLTSGGATSASHLAFGTDTISLNPMTVRCIVISYDYGMIVQSSNGIFKRVGLLRFEGQFFENGLVSTDEYGHRDDTVTWPWTDSVQSRDLRDHFPSVERTVRLD
ncbi:uncharacterized protein FTJAE_2294 [Fusarium tjaetaba]|uniref:Heterokaryon incompatibility domain-containing protein n=1 Tax=Fusarium tjaetaba TaxID=1567544 RepID=A0A8H5S4Q4_9HYPO|nr:uncharacterized protein FTJAE_2294 [Fusarium tjaetaba]KAF5645864.1 hypothetical protein FTJAE_2294 [Fusarium tjaetaba]